MENIRKVLIEDVIEDSMMEFSAYTLLQRAIPDLRDGFKPVYRRILFSMYRMGATKLTKSATVAGEVMKIHPHGSSYPTIVGMSQNDRHTLPLIIGKGNFGNYTSKDLEAAADRYTESKLSDISISMMKDLNKDVVDYVDNYDGTIKVPKVLPVHFPTILVYAQSGIGVGFSSTTASYNINEVCDATTSYLKGFPIPVIIPDFATKGFIIDDVEAFKSLNYTGTGTIILRGKATIEKNEIIITEIPYTTTREAIIEKIVKLSKAGILKEITQINDLTGLNGLEISIVARKNTDMQQLLNKLYAKTPLQSSHSSISNVLMNGKPKVMGVHEIIVEWCSWRKEVVKRGIKNEIEQKKKKLHLLKGLNKVLSNIDHTVNIIRHTKELEVEDELVSYFGLDKIQAEYVAEMKLRNLNNDYITNRIKDTEKLESEIKQAELTAANDIELNKIIIGQLEEVKKCFGVERQTEIIPADKLQDVKAAVEEIIEDYPVLLHLTKDGYVYKTKNPIELNLKPNDKIVEIFNTNNNSELLIFTDDELCYKLHVSKIEEVKSNQIGSYIPNLLKANINVVGYSVLDEKHKFIIMAYKNNKISKIPTVAFEGNRKILKNAYNATQDLLKLLTLSDDRELEIKTTKTKLTLNTSDLKANNLRSATGVYVTRKGELESVMVID